MYARRGFADRTKTAYCKYSNISTLSACSDFCQLAAQESSSLFSTKQNATSEQQGQNPTYQQLYHLRQDVKNHTWKCVVPTTFLIAKAQLCHNVVSRCQLRLHAYTTTLLRSHTCPLPSRWGKVCCKARDQKSTQWSSPLRPQVSSPTQSPSFLCLFSFAAT